MIIIRIISTKPSRLDKGCCCMVKSSVVTVRVDIHLSLLSMYTKRSIQSISEYNGCLHNPVFLTFLSLYLEDPNFIVYFSIFCTLKSTLCHQQLPAKRHWTEELVACCVIWNQVSLGVLVNDTVTHMLTLRVLSRILSVCVLGRGEGIQVLWV